MTLLAELARARTRACRAARQGRDAGRVCARVARLAAMGAKSTASIAHEIDPPLAAIVAEVPMPGLRWLANARADLDETQGRP